MGLWINGGQIATVEDEGVTLLVKVMTARQFTAFLNRANIDPTDEDGIGVFEELVLDGLAGWSGENAPEFNAESVGSLSLSALTRIIKAIIRVNSVSEDERGN